ncbi:MAG: hypothetical protein AB8G99_15710 [Planctomycetaceae bacterium]
MLANAGTPLLWAGLFHLLIGNFIVGILEGLAVARLAKLREGVCMCLMVVANYLSAWVGVTWLFDPSSNLWSGVTIENLRWMLLIQVSAAFFWTVLAELPFMLVSSRFLSGTVKLGFARKMGVHFIVQFASYLVLSLYFAMFSVTSALSSEVVPSSQLMPENVRVLVLEREESRVVEYGRDGNSFDLVSLEGVARKGDRLLVQPRPAGQWSIALVRRAGLNEQKVVFSVLDHVQEKHVPRNSSGVPSQWFTRAWDEQNHLGQGETEWTFYGDIWGNGIRAESPRKTRQFGFSCPLFGWTCNEVTRLPNGVAVFRFGEDQICLYDPETNRAALLGRGTSVLPLLTQSGE